jgi:hypothetical protein
MQQVYHQKSYLLIVLITTATTFEFIKKAGIDRSVHYYHPWHLAPPITTTSADVSHRNRFSWLILAQRAFDFPPANLKVVIEKLIPPLVAIPTSMTE